MIRFFRRLAEARGRRPAVRGYTALQVEAIERAARGGVQDGASTAAASACASLWGRSLALGRLDPAIYAELLPPDALECVGWDLATTGESLWLLRNGGAARVSTHDVFGGGPDEAAWRYRITRLGPGGTETRIVGSADVLHFRHNPARSLMWRGRSPLATAADTARAAGEAEAALGDEAAGPQGSIVPLPAGTPKEAKGEIRGEFDKQRGALLLPGTTAHAGTGDRALAPARDWVPQRLGAAPPGPLVDLRMQAAAALCGAFGVPATLLGYERADGARAREDWRRYTSTTVPALAAVVGAELERKLGAPAGWSFDRLGGGDIAAKARAVHVLKEAGLSVDEARSVVGV